MNLIRRRAVKRNPNGFRIFNGGNHEANGHLFLVWKVYPL
jgi:hypothetical protein